MGTYAIVVIGVGPHGNPPFEPEGDADDLAAQLVATLKERGHRIYEASFIPVDLAAQLVATLKERGHRIYEASFIPVVGEGARQNLEERGGEES